MEASVYTPQGYQCYIPFILNDDYFESGTLPHHTSPISIKISKLKKHKLVNSKSRSKPPKMICLKTRNRKQNPKNPSSAKKFQNQSIFETIKNNSGISFKHDKSDLINKKITMYRQVAKSYFERPISKETQKGAAEMDQSGG